MSAALIAAASEFFGLRYEDFSSRSREIRMVKARAAVTYVMRERDGVSYPTIGRRLKRDHTTIIHAHQRAHAWMDSDQHFAEFVSAQMALPKHCPEAARLKIPKEVQFQFRLIPSKPEPQPQPIGDLPKRPPMTREKIGGLTMMMDADGLAIDDHLWRRSLIRGSCDLARALRREHPERCAA